MIRGYEKTCVNNGRERVNVELYHSHFYQFAIFYILYNSYEDIDRYRYDKTFQF